MHLPILLFFILAASASCKEQAQPAPQQGAPAKVTPIAAPQPERPANPELEAKEPAPAPEPKAGPPPSQLSEEWRKYVTNGEVLFGRSEGVVSPSPDEDPDQGPSCSDGDTARSANSIVLAHVGNKDRQQKVRLETEKECRLFFETLAEASPKKLIGSAEYPLEIAPGRLRSAGRTAYALAESYCAEQDCDGDYTEHDTRIIGLVGPILTMKTESGEIGGGGPPYHGESWSTIDLRTGKQALLLDAVEEASLLAAIKADPYLREQAPEALDGLAAAKTWKEAREVLESESEFGGFEDFAFARYDAKNARVALRLGVVESLGFGTSSVSTLGLWVRPRQQLAPYFQTSHDPLFIGKKKIAIGVGSGEAKP